MSKQGFRSLCVVKRALYTEEVKKLLFVCTSNITRSPACEDILKGSSLYDTKSAGTSPNAAVVVTQELIDWADMIFVMCERTDKHLTYLRKHFILGTKPVIDLDLPDFIYGQRNDPALIEDLIKRMKPYLTI